jgi:hypothetical protein
MAARQIQKRAKTISTVVFVFSAFGIMIVDASPVDTQTVAAVPLQVSMIEINKYFIKYMHYKYFFDYKNTFIFFYLALFRPR